MKKFFKNPFVLILLGALAIYIAFTGSTDRVLCDGVEMKPTDMCRDMSYADKERSNDIFTYGMMGLGIVLIGGSVLNIRNKRKK